ncbi:hypothetical protein [Bordetella trematum]|uniref:hypothetical protein n=1 Tax=Bordetella trematum TaxID=123899 RepID=UPI003AF3E7DB
MTVTAAGVSRTLRPRRLAVPAVASKSIGPLTIGADERTFTAGKVVTVVCCGSVAGV